MSKLNRHRFVTDSDAYRIAYTRLSSEDYNRHDNVSPIGINNPAMMFKLRHICAGFLHSAGVGIGSLRYYQSNPAL